jgi:hypothetical protein
MHYTESLEMDLGELAEIAKRLQALIDAGHLDRIKEIFRDRTGMAGGYHDGQQYHQILPSPARKAENQLKSDLRSGTIRWSYPVIGALVELLGVSENQAVAAAVQINVHGFRAEAIQVINEAYAKLMAFQKRRAS